MGRFWHVRVATLPALTARNRAQTIDHVLYTATSKECNEPIETYVTRVRGVELPRIPLKASIDLTYRCNNRCRHCWLWTADTPEERTRELSVDEWREVVDQSRALGTREWAISGGEPMLRPDFAEIFDYVTSKAAKYSLNTNGTLITPEIAQLLRRKGSKMIALYGATAPVHDHITRSPGSYDALMEGFARMKEAGAAFTVQLIPMRDNWHEWDAMRVLAESHSRTWRIGAAWLFGTACKGERGHAEIDAQRLDPADVLALDEPTLPEGIDASWLEPIDLGLVHHVEASAEAPAECAVDDRLYAGCIAARRDFHVDPFGGMTWCSFVKDPELCYDLRSSDCVHEGIVGGAVAQAWDVFIPSLADKVRGGAEFMEGCAACEIKADCRWCDVYGYLEYGRHGAKVEYLCEVARESRAWKQRRLNENRRYYAVGGMTVCVEADLPIEKRTFAAKFDAFEIPPSDIAGGSEDELLTIRHHFQLPDLEGVDLGDMVYRKAPWAIYRRGSSWIYLGIGSRVEDKSIRRVAVFNDDHTRLSVYSDATRTRLWHEGNLASLTMFATDQIMLSRVLADRQGCYLHSGGIVLNGKGYLFVGHSDAGKSTTMRLLQGVGEVLCDDRNIVRRDSSGAFRVYGTWSHGEVPTVSSADAPLAGILFLRQSMENRIDPLLDRSAARRELMGTIIKPLATADWWEKSLDIIEALVNEIPFYEMRFDKSGAIVPLIKDLAAHSIRVP